MVYKYAVYTWGGFYNEEHQSIHKHRGGIHLFDTKEQRSEYVNMLKTIEHDMKAFHLCCQLIEGFNCEKPVLLHRVSEFNGKCVHTKNESYVIRTYSAAEYIMNYKWYAGFNDYPFGEDFDYSQEGFHVIQEWIEGCFDVDGTVL